MCDHLEFLRYPLDDSFRLLGRAWTAPVLFEILNGTDRFNTILATIPGINPRTLSARLEELQKQGLVTRARTSQSPSRVRYTPTPKGQEMRQIMSEIASFSLRWYHVTRPNTLRSLGVPSDLRKTLLSYDSRVQPENPAMLKPQ